MASPVTVITPSLPARSALLAYAMRSVATQTVPVSAHAIGIDYARQGPAVVRNALLAGVATEWVLFLDDDDLLDPAFIEVLLGESHDADVVVPYCRFDGVEIPPKYHNRPYDREALRQHGIFPLTVLARTELVRDAGGFAQTRYEDWDMWNVMADQKARFKVVPEVLWTYRLGHGNRTHGQHVA